MTRQATESAMVNDEGKAALPPTKAEAERRRVTAQRVREARDRLTSTTGTRPAFDYELLRQFAQNRISASLAVMLLVGTVGFLSGLWTEPFSGGGLDRRRPHHPWRDRPPVPPVPR